MDTPQHEQGIKRKISEGDRNEEVYASLNRSALPKRPKITTNFVPVNTLSSMPVDTAATKKRSHKKKMPTTQDHPVAIGPSLKFPRPWLHRAQSLPEQTVWLLHCHDNVVPGATKPKPWKDVTVEFHEHFRDELPRYSAQKTLSKRVSDSRKKFMADNPDYPKTPYPVPIYDPDDGDDDEPQNGDVESEELGQESGGLSDDLWGEEEQEQEQGPDAVTPEPDYEEIFQPKLPNGIGEPSHRPIVQIHQEEGMEDPASIFPLPTTYEVPVEIPALHAAPEVHSTDASAQLPQIGGASSISDHTISVIDRMKYHLRCRTVEHVTFIYLNLGEEEANMLDQDAQYIDHDILVEASPTYARHVQKHPDRPIKVPKSITAKTVNAFSQIVSPVRAIRLPTHYLWPSKNSIPRVFDRFGAIDPEKINWSVGTLLELVAFARYMDILWMCDMAIDRLHWMFTEQSKLSEICRKKFTQNGWMNVNGRFVRVDNHLPSVPDLQDRSLSAKDFESDHLDQLFAEPVDVPTLMFVADLIFALGDESELISASQEVEQIFEAAAKTPQYSCLIGVARQYFCTRYHYHAADEACYTAYLTPTGQLLVDQAYTTESHDQLLKLSIGLAPANSLESIMYARTEDKGELQQDNSTPEMLEAEKQLLFMELQLEAAKAAMEKVRHAAKEDKCESLIAARNLLS